MDVRTNKTSSCELFVDWSSMCVNTVTRTHKVKCSYTNILHMQTHLGTLTFAYTYIHKHAFVHTLTHTYTDVVYTFSHVENTFQCFFPHNHIFIVLHANTRINTNMVTLKDTHLYICIVLQYQMQPCSVTL